MSAGLYVRNESRHKRLYRSDALRRLVEHILEGESVPDAIELSILFCDDPFIQELNRKYRNIDKATDVLSFEQETSAVSPRPLGDIVISLDTVERNCEGDRFRMREEIRLLVCHGLLHLLGYDHATAGEQALMREKQAEYLGISDRAAWAFGPEAAAVSAGVQ